MVEDDNGAGASADAGLGVPGGSPGGLTVALCGDVLLHRRLWAQAALDGRRTGQDYDFGPMLAGLQSAVSSADLAVAHLETPVGHPRGPFGGYPVYAVPPQVLPALRAVGFAGVTTASNHSLDAGTAGIDRTIAALDEAGLRHAGTASSAAAASRTTVFEVGGVSVALLSFAYGFNGFRLPAGRSWAANPIDVPTMLDAAGRARAGGAQIVVVAVHAGDQYVSAPSTQQLRVFDALTRSDDVDFVYGHHAHVVQPLSRVNGKLVAYGLGNAVADLGRSLPETRSGLLARVRFEPAAPGRFIATSVDAVPTWMSSHRPLRWLDARSAGTAPVRVSAGLARAARVVDRAVRSGTGPWLDAGPGRPGGGVPDVAPPARVGAARGGGRPAAAAPAGPADLVGDLAVG